MLVIDTIDGRTLRWNHAIPEPGVRTDIQMAGYTRAARRLRLAATEKDW
jgi:hypothetical protein